MTDRRRTTVAPYRGLSLLAPGRDSGAIEEAADYLLGIWRPELAENLQREEREKVRGQFKVRVLKNRSGPAPKTLTLHFDTTTLRIGAPAVAENESAEWPRT